MDPPSTPLSESEGLLILSLGRIFHCFIFLSEAKQHHNPIFSLCFSNEFLLSLGASIKDIKKSEVASGA